MTAQSSSALSCYRRSARALGAKSALAGTAAALLTGSASAQAVAYHFSTDNVSTLVFSNNLNISFTRHALSHGQDHNEIQMRLQVSDYSSYSDRIVSMINVFSGVGKVVTSQFYGLSAARALAPGTPINAASTFGRSFYGYLNPYKYNVVPEWANATGAYAGVKFSLGDGYHYGWLQLSTNSRASEVTLLGFGYNLTPGASILAGEGVEPSAIPEPATSAALLALGAAGLVAYRQRKQLRRA